MGTGATAAFRGLHGLEALAAAAAALSYTAALAGCDCALLTGENPEFDLEAGPAAPADSGAGSADSGSADAGCPFGTSPTGACYECRPGTTSCAGETFVLCGADGTIVATIDCSAFDDPCNTGMCDEASLGCIALPRADGLLCDDGLFCTASDACLGGACVGGGRDCSSAAGPCNGSACDEVGEQCVPVALADGVPCDDSNPCTTTDACQTGVCAGAPLCPEDGYACTLEGCDPTAVACLFSRSEAPCGPDSVCNPVAYPGGASGCGPAPVALTLACPALGTAGALTSCLMTLTDAAGAGIAGEESRISCLGTPGDVLLFADNFDDGVFDPPWTAVLGTPATSLVSGTDAAWADATIWEADVTLAAAGLDVTCVDFDLAQEDANSGERARWSVSFDGGPFASVIDLDFDLWENDDTTHAYNLEPCANVPPGTTDLTWRLHLESDDKSIWLDNLAVTGIGAPWFVPANGGPDDLATEAGWTFTAGTAPYVGTWGGSSALFAQTESFAAARASIDASSCDVLDVDFAFGFRNPDQDDSIRLETSVGGGPFAPIEFLHLRNGQWNANSVLLTWFGLRRVSSLVADAARSPDVLLRFALASDDGGDAVWVDDFVVRCADLPEPAVAAVIDLGGGDYQLDVSAAVPEDAYLHCFWVTPDDGPIADESRTLFLP